MNYIKRALFLLAILGVSPHLFGSVYVEAPVTIEATVTTMAGPVYSATGVTVKETVTKINNAALLRECVARRIISSTSGWSIVCYYDAQMDGIYTGSNPSFRLRHKDGRTASLASIISLSVYAWTANGKASFSGSKVNGSLSARPLYYLQVAYQGYLAVCAGIVPVKLNISGTKTKYIGVANPVSVHLDGYLDRNYDSIVQAKLSIGTFKQR